MSNTINITVKRVLYPPVTLEGNWFVLLANEGKCSGEMLWRPEPGERLTLSGKWGAYRGERNFKFDNALPNVPVNLRDQLIYVCERADGIGPVIMDDIWTARGDDWRNIESGEIARLKGAKYQAFREAVALFDSEVEKSNTIAWLMGHGATVTMASAAWEMWEKKAVGIVKADCYRLTELPHYGFIDVDKAISKTFYIDDADPRRARAAILYAAEQLMAGGSTVISWTLLSKAAYVLIGQHHAELIANLAREMFADGKLHGFPETWSVALGRDYKNEEVIWRFVKEE